MYDIQEAKCFAFTYQILPPTGSFFKGAIIFLALRTYLTPPPRFVFGYALGGGGEFSINFKQYLVRTTLEEDDCTVVSRAGLQK